MRKIFLFLILIIAVPCSGQWTSCLGPGFQVLSYGVHDTDFFIGVEPMSGLDALIYRYIKPLDLSDDDTAGLDRSQGNITSFASLGNYFFAGQTYSNGENAGVYSSTDNGLHWLPLNLGSPVAAGLGNRYLYGMYGTSVARSTDFGATATRTPLTMPLVNCFCVLGPCVLAANGSGIARSADTGQTWTSVTAPLTNIISFAFANAIVYATNGIPGVSTGQLMRSTDSGAHWAQMSTPGFTVECLASDGKHLFAGGGDGLFLLDSDGVSWLPKTDSLTPHAIVSLGVFDTLLLADVSLGSTSNYYDLYSRSIPAMFDTTKSGVVEALTPGDTLELYPNPSMGTVTVLSGGTSLLGVSVLNVLGEDVLDMPNLRESNITLDLSNIPSGTYFLHIETSNGSVLRKVAIQH
jgi:Secretion system C-terminal sorting domain